MGTAPPPTSEHNEVLVIEDQRDDWHRLRDILRQAGYEAQWEYRPYSGQAYAIDNDPGVVLVDLLFSEDRARGTRPLGIDVIRNLRQRRPHLPIIALTWLDDREQGADAYIAEALAAGADTYVCKKSRPSVLIAHIANAYRRRELDQTQIQDGDDPGEIRIGNLIISLSSCQVSRDGRPLDVTGQRYKLLVYMARNVGRILNADQLGERVLQRAGANPATAVKEAVHALRKVIEEDPHHPRYIVTYIGLGYMFTSPVEASNVD